MSRRKFASPKKLNEADRSSANWHINLQKSSLIDIDNQQKDVANLIDDRDSDEEDGVSSKVAKIIASASEKFAFNWGRQKQKNYEGLGINHNFIVLQNLSTVNLNDEVALIKLGSFQIRLIDAVAKDLPKKLYLHNNSDETFRQNYSTNWILFFKNPWKEDEQSGVLCHVDLNDDEYKAVKSNLLSLLIIFDQNLTCSVFLNEMKLKSFNKSHDNSTLMKVLMKKFANVDYFCPKNHPKTRENVDDFFQKLMIKRSSMNVETFGVDPQHDDLIPILRSYQRRAVEWMIWREKFVDSSHPLFTRINLNGRLFFYNPFQGILQTEQPPTIHLGLPGGILADEMGLGKTVEILALILLNPKTSRAATTLASVGRGLDERQLGILPDVREIVEELISVVTSNVETDLTFERKLEEQTKRKNDKKRKKARDYVQSTSKKIGPKLSCFCGLHDFDKDPSPRILCQKCGSVQHNGCVNWTWTTIDDYLCPHCRVVDQVPVESKTTLIISPTTICYQWHQEILKHIRSYALKVYIYQGVQAEGFVQPKTLAGYDIVITTYEILRSELNFVDMPHFSRLRHAKRFLSAPSPITAVFWWRVCLDEAQMVEGHASKAAEMCLRLPTVNRWCVTGTPIQKSADDLYGLWKFLGIEPYCERTCWTSALFLPYLYGQSKYLVDAVAPVLWRTIKVNVLDQLGVPQQQQKLTWLEFGPVEEHFYRRTQEECAKNVNLILNRFADHSLKLQNIDRSTLDKILRPLLKLRLACCHPQMVRGRFVNLQKNNMTMEEVLENMIKKTKNECEDEHRAIVASHNGLAGLQQLKQNWTRSAEIYRQVLQLCESYGGKIRTDPLPKIHALHNLYELIVAHGDDIPPTCRDDQLRAECDDMKLKYLSKTLNSLEKFKLQMNETTFEVDAHSKELTDVGETWWIEVCVAVRSRADAKKDVLDRVKNVLSSSKTSTSVVLSDQITETYGLQMVLVTLYDALKQSRVNLNDSLRRLVSNDVDDDLLLNEASVCHLRPKNGINLETCPICIVDRNFDDYESKLFNFEPFDAARGGTIQDADENDAVSFVPELRRGTWADSPLEQALKVIFQFINARRFVADDVLDSGRSHLKLFDLMKKEFKAFRSVWMAVRDHVALRDELSIAVERFRLRTPADGTSTESNLVDRCQLDVVEMKLSSDRVVAEGQLQRKLGHLSYLTSLQSIPVDDEQGNPEECPVCRVPFGFRWSLLTCGHAYCCNCVRILLNAQLIKCPICRQATNRNNISYVTTRRKGQQTTTDNIDIGEIKGSHSTKVEAVVKCLMEIQRNKSPSAKKCLVFSNWREVLEIVASALEQNNMKFFMLNSQNLQKTLNGFKASPDCNILLLPITNGANGLNIIEATHVLLVDPLLNPAAEQQALGRVHRIGQKKLTTVYKFLIRGTVEQKMYDILGDAKTDRLINDVDSPLTVGDLVNLFKI